MKKQIRKFAILAVVLLTLATLGWAEDVKLNNTGVTPAAIGTIHTDMDRNGNTTFEVTLDHIAAPQALSPAAQYYVVWLQPRGQQAMEVGRLRVNRDNLAGSIQGTTPYDNFQIFITAENSEVPASPSSTVLLRGTVQRR